MRKGSITVFLCLLLLVFLGFAGSLLALVKSRLMHDRAEQALAFGAEEMLTHYYLPLYDRYHLFGLVWGEEEMGRQMTGTVKTALTQAGSFRLWNSAEPLVTAGHPVSMEDYGGALYRRQVQEYQKYHVVGKAEMPDLKPLEEQAAVMEILADRADLYKAQSEASADVLALYTCLEGIRTGPAGLRRSRGTYETKETFAKMFVPAEVTMNAVGITKAEVFRALERRYVCLPELCADILAAEEGEELAALPEGLSAKADGALSALREAREHLKKAGEAGEALEEARRQYRERLLERKGELTEETFAALWEDAAQEGGVLEGISDRELASELDRLEELLTRVKGLCGAADGTSLRGLAEGLSEDLDKYSLRRLRFRYPDTGTQDEGNLWDFLLGAVQPGFLKLLYGDGPFSEKSLDEAGAHADPRGNVFVQIALRFREEGVSLRAAVQEVTEMFLLQNYAADHMRCMSDGACEEVLDYQYEYLLGGKASDAANLCSVAEKILLCRTAVNLLAAMTCPAMREQAEMMARGSVGLTMLEPLVQGVKYLVLLAWAAEESIVELRALSLGKKLSWLKRGEQFAVQREDLFAFSGEMAACKAEELAGNGPDYRTFLNCFLWLQNLETTTQRMMHLTESNLSYLHGVPFRMSRCYVSFRADLRLEAGGSFGAGASQDVLVTREYGYR